MKSHRALASVLVLCLLLAFPGAAAAQSGGYVVQRGDTLATIAARFGTTVPALARANGIANPNHIYAGQRLVIPGRTQASTGSSTSSTGTGARYTIRKGDTLGSIAARFGVSAAAIARANGLTNPNLIRTGMQLTIPGASAASTGSSGGAPAPKSSGSSKPPTAGQGTRFVASISQQTCWLYQGNKVAYQWRCSTGRSGSPTVPGTYAVRTKLGKAWGGTWGFWMPYWLGIYMAGSLENGIHGLPYSPTTGQRWWGDKIGTPISYGCVVLDDAAARTLFNFAYIGMPVIVLR